MKIYDVANMFGAWNRSLGILIGHLEKNESKIALQRAYAMRSMVHKEMGFCQENDMEKIERELIDKL